jgi:hypothetical protein
MPSKIKKVSAAARETPNAIMFSRWLAIRMLDNGGGRRKLGYSARSTQSTRLIIGYRENARIRPFDEQEVIRAAEALRLIPEQIELVAKQIRTAGPEAAATATRLASKPDMSVDAAAEKVVEDLRKINPPVADLISRGRAVRYIAACRWFTQGFEDVYSEHSGASYTTNGREIERGA